MQFSDLRDACVAALKQCAALASETDASGRGWLEREVSRHAGQIREAALADEKKAFSNERFEQEVTWMLTFARQRAGQIERQVGR
jgi:hypothetical protein